MSRQSLFHKFLQKNPEILPPYVALEHRVETSLFARRADEGSAPYFQKQMHFATFFTAFLKVLKNKNITKPHKKPGKDLTKTRAEIIK